MSINILKLNILELYISFSAYKYVGKRTCMLGAEVTIIHLVCCCHKWNGSVNVLL